MSLFQKHEQEEPNLLNFVPKHVWREVYNGRWNELSKVQRSEFVLELALWTATLGGIAYFSYKSGQFLTVAAWFGGIGIVLGLFFLIMTRFIR